MIKKSHYESFFVYKKPSFIFYLVIQQTSISLFSQVLLKMNRLFGSSKSNAVPKPTLNDTAASLDSRVETINKQIAAVEQGLIN